MCRLMPITDEDGCSPTLCRLADGGWTVQNVFVFHPYKPGVLEIWEVSYG